MAACTNLVAYRGNNGQTYTFVLTGTILAGQSSYKSSTQNGIITSRLWGSWSSSYSIISATG